MKLVCLLVGIMLTFGVVTKGQSSQDTLEVVNWNLEFFGDRASDLPEEMWKTRTIMNNLDADIYALTEIVNTDSLHSLVQSLQGGFNYIVSPFGSFAAGPSSSQYRFAQKLAFVYRSSMVRNVSGRAMMKTSATAYDYWASGRFPYLVTAEVLGKDNQWRLFRFVIIHAKANSDYSSCFRRYAGALEMKDTLDTYYSDDRIVILGDFNDDLDESICPSFLSSTYADLVADSVDANSYKALTLPLSQAGVSTISGYPSFIDHVVVSNEVVPFYVHGSAEMLRDKVTTWVQGYLSDVSDHYPVLTKYVMDDPTHVATAGTLRQTRIYPVPAKETLNISNISSGLSDYELYSADGRKVAAGKIAADAVSISVSQLPAGVYLLKLCGDAAIQLRKISVAK